MRYLVVLALALALGGCTSKSGGRRVRIAAASDLTRAFGELGKEFEQQTHITPELSFGASGQLARQIADGAPLFLFAAANHEFVEQAISSGRCDASSARTYARGRLVVWTPSSVVAPTRLADLADPRFGKIAIADPAHAPYGRAAKQALERAGIWTQVEPRIVLADNIQATMTAARDHTADVAIVALSLAVVADGGAFVPIDPALHDPLDQQLVVCGNGAEADAARQFAAFVDSREGREIMTRYGFLLPDEGSPK